MQFVLILAVLSILAIAEYGQQSLAANPTGALVAAVAGIAAVVGAAWFLALRTANGLRSNPHRRCLLLRQFALQRKLHAVLWLCVTGGLMLGLDWVRVVHFNWNLRGAFLADEFLILLPLMLPLVLSWAAFYEVDRALRELRGQADVDDLQTGSRLGYLDFHLRHVVGLWLLPLGILLVSRDAVELVRPGLLEGEHGWVVLLAPVAAVFLFFPVMLRYLWRAEPLEEGPLRNRLEAAAQRWGLQVQDILVWNTDGMVLNAAVAGFLPRLRYVFLSDGLIGHMTDEEIEAVFGHEIGHIRHHHVFLRAIVMLAPISLGMIWQYLASDAAAATVPASNATLTPAVEGALLGLFLISAYIAAVFGFYSRRLERQADLFGCRVASASGETALAAVSEGFSRASPHLNRQGIATFISALEKLAALNGIGRRNQGWQHWSIADRVDYLEKVAEDPAVEQRSQRQIRWLASVIVGIACAGLVYPVVALLG